ncbi:MAG TPA: peptidylprolyl isomerase [Bryobacteraceae bacterium]|nr:peptidylprolyl isomerase [Bryobacteraceae bacterium]
MKTPSILILAAWTAAIGFGQSPRKPGLYAVFHTSLGDITAQLYEKDTPTSVHTFVNLATGVQAWLDPETHKPVKRPLYNNITFHRVVPGEMIQAGDPTGKGTHNCGFTIRDEFLPGLRFDRAGRLAMANTGQPDSGGCQFFITVGPMPMWSGKYTIFGQVVDGMDVVEKINRARVRDEKPLEPVTLISVTIEREGPGPGKKK